MYYLCERMTYRRFLHELRKAGLTREYSKRAQKAIYDHLNTVAYEIGQPIVFDPLDILAHYHEYSSINEIIAIYELWDDVEATQNIKEWIDRRFERVVFDVDESGKGLIVLMKYDEPRGVIDGNDK